MRHLYVKQVSPEKIPVESDFLKSCRVEVLYPQVWRLHRLGEKISFKEGLSRLLFRLMAGKRYRIYYLYSGEDIVHTAHLVPPCKKFPFLQKGEWELGPCVTRERYRRRGVYHYMLRYLSALEELKGDTVYLLIRRDNTASIGGAEKSGFVRCGSVRKTKYLTYERENEP